MDNTARDTGMVMTTRKNAAHGTTTFAPEHSLHVFTCGGKKITPLRGDHARGSRKQQISYSNWPVLLGGKRSLQLTEAQRWDKIKCNRESATLTMRRLAYRNTGGWSHLDTGTFKGRSKRWRNNMKGHKPSVEWLSIILSFFRPYLYTRMQE